MYNGSVSLSLCRSTFLTFQNSSPAKDGWGKVSQPKLKGTNHTRWMCILLKPWSWSMGKKLYSSWYIKLYTFLLNYLKFSSKWKHRSKTRVCEPITTKLLMAWWLKVGGTAQYMDVHIACQSIVYASVGRAYVTLKNSLRCFAILCSVILSICTQP